MSSPKEDADSMTINRKLFLSTGAALLLTVIMGAAALWVPSSLGRDVNTFTDVNAHKLRLAGEMSEAMAECLAFERGIIAHAYLNDRAAMEQNNEDFHETLARLQRDYDVYYPLVASDEGRRLAAEFLRSARTIEQNHGPYWNEAASGQRDAAAATYRDLVSPGVKAGMEMGDKLVARQWELTRKARTATTDSIAEIRWTIAAILAVSFLVALIAVFMILRIGAALRRAVSSLAESASQVAAAAGQVSSSSQSLARSSSDQAASIEETSASAEEINSMAVRNGESSRAAAELVTQAGENFSRAYHLLDETVAAMAEINSSSDKISKINKVIDEIAFQTNILALNAAVEAARAGEAGMGFAVVADEVRNLAHRCSQAAKDTAGLIEESITRSRDGKTKVDDVAVAVRKIGDQAQQVKAIVDQVHVGSQEQSRGISQIGQAITQMEKMTQEAAATAEESAAAAEELNAQSTTLRDVVDRLTAMVG